MTSAVVDIKLVWLKYLFEWGAPAVVIALVAIIAFKVIVDILLPVIKELRVSNQAASTQMEASISTLRVEVDRLRQEVANMETKNRELELSNQKMHLEVITLRQRLDIALRFIPDSHGLTEAMKDFLLNGGGASFVHVPKSGKDDEG